MIQRINLKLENNLKIYFNKNKLESLCYELTEFLKDQSYMDNLKYAKKLMISQEIKTNNLIEGIKDDLAEIDNVINRRNVFISEDKKKRIINLYHGYDYILHHQDINKNSLKKLYDLLSEELLEKEYHNNMGEHYRKGPVYIMNGNSLSKDPFMGMDVDNLDYFMNQLFRYIHNELKINNSDIDTFITSQIIHFYFVYVHPYFDINGRTGRTLSMWYLLNKKAYPYIIFNRAISFSKGQYDRSIIQAREGNITPFLTYMLENVSKEFEKEYVVYTIEEGTKLHLSKEESQIIHYFLSMNGNLTAKDLAIFYNNFNDKRKLSIIYDEKIKPLIEKDILLPTTYTNGNISEKIKNVNIVLNRSKLAIDESKIKRLNIRNLN